MLLLSQLYGAVSSVEEHIRKDVCRLDSKVVASTTDTQIESC